MGLDCSHDAWHGAYSAFDRWRQKLAEVAGLPPLDLMDGFYGSRCRLKYPDIDSKLPISWDCLKPSPLHELLSHSDCDGEIAPDRCGPIADALEALIPLLPDEEDTGHIGIWKEKTAQFVKGLRAAAAAGEPLDFH